MKRNGAPMCSAVQSPQKADHGGRLAGWKQLISGAVAVTIPSIKVQVFSCAVAGEEGEIRTARTPLTRQVNM